MFTDRTWHLITGLWLAAIFTYLGVQGFAFRFKGHQKQRGNTVFAVMVAFVAGSGIIREAYENRIARQVGDLVTGAAAIVAIIVLTRILRESRVTAPDTTEDEHKIQTLKLS